MVGCCSVFSFFASSSGPIKLPQNDSGIFTKDKCIFCNISKGEGFDVITETPTLVVFRDIRPRASEHLLVTAKAHVDNVKSLTKDDAESVKSMISLGSETLTSLGFPESSQRFGFHIPPFNSVQHLHLHSQGLPYNGGLARLEFRSSSSSSAGKTKGFSWFVEGKQVVEILERGGRVGVFGS